MSIFSSVWTYILSFGALGFLILAFLAGPYILPFIQPIGEFLKPVAKAVGEFIGWTINVVMVGIQDILDTWQTMVTVAILALLMGWWLHPVYDAAHCQSVVNALHTKYKFVPKPGAVAFTLPWWSSWF